MGGRKEGIEGMGRWDYNEKERTAHETHTLHTCTQKYWLSVCKHNVLQLYIQLVSVNKLRANICINVNALLTLDVLGVFQYHCKSNVGEKLAAQISLYYVIHSRHAKQ